MNKSKFKEMLLNETNYSKDEVDIISNIIDEIFIIGKNNKKKMISEFVNQLNIDEKEADELYNKSMGIIMNSIKNKIIHPFKKDE